MNRFFAAFLGNLATIFALAIITLVIGLVQAEAQGIPCAPIGVIEQQLADEHGETLRAIAPADVPGGIAYLYTNASNGSFSVLIHPEPELTCLIDAGQSDSLKEREA